MALAETGTGFHQSSSNPARKRILVVDDELDILFGIRALLRGRYDVDVAVGAAMALVKLRKRSYDLILLDYRMPSLTGADVVERLGRIGVRTPVILMSELPFLGNREVLALPVAGRLIKPINPVELDARIDALLARPARVQG